MRLSVVCVTQAESRALPFVDEQRQLAQYLRAEFVLGASGARAVMAFPNAMPVEGEYLEQMLPQMFKRCTGQFVLRLDDDERCTPAMVEWLKAGSFTEYDNWHFCRAHLWPDEKHHIVSPPYWPDYQTRLSIRAKANRPATLHAGSPYPGRVAPCAIEHHTFLVKNREERRAITNRYQMLTGKPTIGPEAPVMPEDGNLEVASW